MQVRGRFEKQIVLRHGVVHARARENQAVIAAERRDHDCDGHNDKTGGSEHRVHRGSTNGRPSLHVSRSDYVRGKDVQVGHVGKHVQGDDDHDARGHRKGEIFLRLFHLGGCESHVVPGVHREQRADHCGANDRQQPQREARCGPEIGPKVRGDRLRVPADRQSQHDQGRERRGLDDSERSLDEGGGADPADVDPGEDCDGRDCEQPLPGEADGDVANGLWEMQRSAGEHSCRDGWEEDGREARERHGDGGNRPRLDDDE